jgi:hypothetical protein
MKNPNGFHSLDCAWEFACAGKDEPADNIYVVGRRPERRKVGIQNPNGSRVEVVTGTQEGIGQVWPIAGYAVETTKTAKEQPKKQKRKRATTKLPPQRRGQRRLRSFKLADEPRERIRYYFGDGVYRPIQVDGDIMLPPQGMRGWLRLNGDHVELDSRIHLVGPEDLVQDDRHVERFQEIMGCNKY